MFKIRHSTIFHGTFAVFALLLAILNFYLVKSFDIFGSPLLFALGLLAELLIIITFVYSVLRALRTPLYILISLLKSAWSGILTNKYVKRLRIKKLPFSKWFIARLDASNPYGLLLTIGVAVALVFFIGFGGMLKDVWFQDPLTRTDARVANLMPSIRTPLQTTFFSFVTFTANNESILLLFLIASIFLWIKRQKVVMALLVIALATEESSAFILKKLVGRVRPEQSLSIVKEASLSFPSGHVLRATVLFGFLSYLLYRSFTSYALRLFTILGYVISVSLVALSRVYLGVHYPSDVLASILFGAVLLTLLITAIEIVTRFHLWEQKFKSYDNRLLGLVPIIVILFSLIAHQYFIKIIPVNNIKKHTTLSEINNSTIKRLPLYSETLTGIPMEPISFIIIGSAQSIDARFTTFGWYKADPATLANTLKVVSFGFRGRQYLNAPVTPSYLAAKPENLAFQKPTKLNTLRQRHHIRLWQTNFKLPSGEEVWLAAASYDEGIGFTGRAKLPTHRIDPNVDAERSFIVNSLKLKIVKYFQVVNPQAGNNASGDVFFTDGRAVLVNFNG